MSSSRIPGTFSLQLWLYGILDMHSWVGNSWYFQWPAHYTIAVSEEEPPIAIAASRTTTSAVLFLTMLHPSVSCLRPIGLSVVGKDLILVERARQKCLSGRGMWVHPVICKSFKDFAHRRPYWRNPKIFTSAVLLWLMNRGFLQLHTAWMISKFSIELNSAS